MLKKPVLRSCALTHEKLLKSDLFRIVRDKDGKYYYYLSQYNEDDYFAEGGKH